MSTTTAVSSSQLARVMSEFWTRAMRGHESAMFELVEELGITLTQVKTLQLVTMSEEELTVKDIADRLNLSLPTTSRTVDTLLRHGWVERREDEHDRRMKRVRSTTHGRDVAQQLWDARMKGIEEIATALSPAQRATLHAAFIEAGRFET